MSEARIGKFEVVRRLGRGGMGTVYEGYDRSLDRQVAIKTLTADSLSDEDSRRRFEREARAAARLQHPNIVTIHELGNFGGQGTPYIVMEYLGGADLSALIDKNKPIPLTAALGIAAQLCWTLDFAHQKAVIHRDVKPSNIRYLEEGRIKIVDFGIARMEGGSRITRTGIMMGTLHYMSPEQIRGKSVDGRSDIFSAGCILYEMLTGNRPFEGKSATAILYKIVHETPRPILEVNTALPEQTQDILNRALAKEAKDRFPTAGAMAQELEKLLNVVRRSLPRPLPALQSRLNELERLRHQGSWSQLLPLAEAIMAEQPALETPWQAYHQARREIKKQEDAKKRDQEEQTPEMSEIAREIQHLKPVSTTEVPLVTPRPPSLSQEVEESGTRTIAKTHLEKTAQPHIQARLAGALALVLALAAVLGWLVFRRPPAPRNLTQTVFIASEPSGSAVYVNGNNRGLTTQPEGFVEVPLEGTEGETFNIELRMEGYRPASATVSLGSRPPSPFLLSLEPLAQELLIQTTPSGATLQIDGERLDRITPTRITVSPNKEHLMVVSKDGYHTRRLTIPDDGNLLSNPIVLSPRAAVGDSTNQPGLPEASQPRLDPDREAASSEPTSTTSRITETERVEPTGPPGAETVVSEIPQPSTEESAVHREKLTMPDVPSRRKELESKAPDHFGALMVRSEYALSILSGGDTLVETLQDPTVKLRAGRHEIILLAPEVLLNQAFTVEVREDQKTEFFAPTLGKASVRSFPENGRLTINGIPARDLPIIDLPIVAGTHTFLFRWPDGSQNEQTVVVRAGERVYVTGQIR